MGGFKLGKMTLRSLFGKPATVKYPFEKREPYPAMRGHVVNDVDACIFCGLCARACPAEAITVDRKAGDWTIDPYECVQCGYCVSQCPKNCLSMAQLPSPAVPELVKVTMHKDVPAKPAAGAAGGAAKAGAAAAAARPKPKLTPEQEARVAAAKAAKAAKEAAKRAE